MSTIKNVILIGATGNLGPSILKALQESGQFNVTVLTRDASKSGRILPPGTRATTADFESIDSLTAAFKGQDAVVSAISSFALGGSNLLVDAAINAGVKRFIASEFGSDVTNEKASTLAVFVPRISARKYLEEKSAEGKITWTAIANGAFLEWGLATGFLGLRIGEKKATLYDGGNLGFSATTLPTIGAAVAGVLSHPKETENKYIRIQSVVTTQSELVALYEKHQGAKWEIEHVDTAELERETNKKLADNDYTTVYNLIFRAAFGEGYGGEFKEDSNDLLGLPKLLDAKGLEDVVKSTL